MSVRPAVILSKPDTLGFERVDVWQWADLAAGDTGGPIELPAYADRTAQASGIFGVGGSIVIEGSLDGDEYHTLHDPGGWVGDNGDAPAPFTPAYWLITARRRGRR